MTTPAASLHPQPRRLRPQAGHVVLGLMALVVIVATASYLGAAARPEDQPTAALVLDLDEAAAKSQRDFTAGAMDQALPMSTVEAAADDGTFAAEPAARVDDALIVRTASLELEVDDVTATLPAARSIIAGLGGYVSGSDEYDQGESRWASVTYRIPVERFSEAVEALRGLAAHVVRESTQSTEVTATVIDLDARIANLRASEAALVEIMDRAGRIEDVLSVQVRLEDVRGQIEVLEAQRAHLADQAALSTITVSWFTPVAAVTVARSGWDLGTEVDTALAQTVEALQRVASLGVWFAVVVVPLLGAPLLVLALLVAVLRRRGRQGNAGGPDGGAALGVPAAD